MLKGLGDMANLIKLQKEMKSIQKKLKSTVLEGSSPDGLVKATVNGEFKLIGINIDSSLIKEDDAGRVEKTVVSAVNDAVDKIKEHSQSEMMKLTGGMDLPGIF
ncbi:YbaB/EbfC family nucleoid-associated protein [Spirochaetota bacterium]